MATLTLASTIGFSQPSSYSDISVYSIPFSTRRLSFSRTFPSPLKLQKQAPGRRARLVLVVKMAAEAFQEVLPPALTSASEPPPIFDGTTRLYISYTCPYAQRVWITRNCKGLQNKIQLVPINLQDRPSWYKEKVYPPNKVPALERNNEVKGESLDLIKYIDSNFEGPSLFPDDPGKREFAEELINYVNSFSGSVVSSFKGGLNEADVAFDYLESALSKYEDGPFFLGHFCLVDIAYAPFIERFQPFLLEVKTYDITAGRPKLAAWIETRLKKAEIMALGHRGGMQVGQEMNKIEGYRQTRGEPREHVDSYKKRFLSRL